MEKGSLADYVAKRIGAGVAKAEIREELLAVGWSEEEADAAYRDGVVSLGAPVPSEGNRPTSGKKSSTVDIIINLFSFILLGIVATSLGVLYFQVINRFFPDPLRTSGSSGLRAISSAIHYSVSALLIAYPFYYGTMRLWFRKFRENEGRTESRLSKWITYIVLLAAAVTVIGDLITVVFTFLQGELTARFFLKALTVLAIASGIFGFYFFERRKIQYRKEVPAKTFRSFGMSVTGVVVLGVVLGFFAGESPEVARDRTFDWQRESDLRSLSDCIGSYASDSGSLPASIDDLTRASGYLYCASYAKDPETGEEYGYRIVTASRQKGVVTVGEYELCADYALESEDVSGGTDQYGIRDVWGIHSAGRSCDTVSTQLGTLAPVMPEKEPVPAAGTDVK